jgi:hypothetical protein
MMYQRLINAHNLLVDRKYGLEVRINVVNYTNQIQAFANTVMSSNYTNCCEFPELYRVGG